MAYIITAQTNAPTASWLSGKLHTVADRLEKYALYRKTLNELSQLSNRELADLAIHRSAIRGLAYQSVYGD
ncbi:DUF1127 domain-containing protein [Algirhabdus cladophorae]|uniref:DUF1127 domain-containing protein n=1 Tax=Algirhabdus cladophorae TaxID=3377108 RepID=UPI003B846463